jgi:hypothetical protein
MPERAAKPELTSGIGKFDSVAGTKKRTLNSRPVNQALSTLWLPEGTKEKV